MKIAKLRKILRFSLPGFNYLIGRSVLSPPMDIHVETTNVCNFRCVYCPQSDPEKHFGILPAGKMSLADFKNLMDRLADAYPGKSLLMARDGEPFAHPQLEEFIAYASGKGFAPIGLSSNGSLITKDRALAAISAGLSSMKGDFSADRDRYEALRAGARFDRALDGYRNVLRAAKESGVPFKLLMADVCTHDMKDPARIQESLSRLRALFEGYEPWLDVFPAIMHNALGESQQTLSTSTMGSARREYNRCPHPFFKMVIDYRGNVVACCRDLRSEYIVGNVLEVEDVHRDIWNGEAMRHLRRSIVRREPEKIDVCRKCDLPYGHSYGGKGFLGKVMKLLRSE